MGISNSPLNPPNQAEVIPDSSLANIPRLDFSEINRNLKEFPQIIEKYKKLFDLLDLIADKMNFITELTKKGIINDFEISNLILLLKSFSLSLVFIQADILSLSPEKQSIFQLDKYIEYNNYLYDLTLEVISHLG